MKLYQEHHRNRIEPNVLVGTNEEGGEMWKYERLTRNLQRHFIIRENSEHIT